MTSARSDTLPINGVQFQDTCFACGARNPRGLQLTFHIEVDGTATANLALGPEWEGPQGVTHGGIVATLLDEAMAKAAAAAGYRSMTADLRVRFHRYAATGEQLLLQGWIVRRKSRLIETEGRLVANDGNERARAWGKFLAVGRPSDIAESATSCDSAPLTER